MIMSKEMFKKMVKEKVIKKSFEILTKIQATHSKAKNIEYKDVSSLAGCDPATNRNRDTMR